MEEFTEKLILRSELYNKLSKAKEKYENDFDTDKVIKQSYYKTRCDRIDQIKGMIEFYKEKQKHNIVLMQTLFQNVVIMWDKFNSAEIREYNIKPIPLEVKENYDEM